MLYNIARNRHHFGKDFVDSFMFNKITIAPLSDGELQKIDYQIGIDDDLLLIALIFKRFAPEQTPTDLSGVVLLPPPDVIEAAGREQAASSLEPQAKRRRESDV